MNNKRYTTIVMLSLGLLMLATASNIHATETKISKNESSITAVTVFTDRALVTRTISKRLTKGEHVLVFDNLPETIDQNSIQANGEGFAILRDVKFKKEFYPAVANAEQQLLKEKIVALQDSLVDANDVVSNANKEKMAVELLMQKASEKITVVSGNDKILQEPDPDKWIKLVNFYRTKLDALTRQMRTTERKIRILNENLDLLQKKMSSMSNNDEKYKNFVEVAIEVKEESNVTINLSYMVIGPRWYPAYDLRVLTDTKKMKIIYQAVIQQSTTEDWNGVHLKLSTARVNLSGQQPILNPWILSIYDNSMPTAADEVSEKKAEMVQMYNSISAKPMAKEKIKDDAGGYLQPVQTSVEQGATAAVFVVPGENTINTDNQQHKVTIMVNEFDAVFRYSAVPKIVPHVFLKAKAKNTTDFSLLAGSTNVFLDNNFVCTARMEQVNPDQEFWTFLGVDDGIEIKYQTLKQYQKDEGLITKKNKFIYDYVIEITNHKKSEEEIVVWDQIPIANSEDIKITLEKPNLESDKEHVKIDDNKFLEWYYKVKSSEKIKIPFQFTVECPKNKQITGL
jgi:uncharacterized protein (TIGR02231 family)